MQVTHDYLIGTFMAIESDEFRFLVNTASGYDLFRESVTKSLFYNMLQRRCYTAVDRERLFIRVIDLVDSVSDGRYEHPYDTAIAAYLLMLSEESLELAYALSIVVLHRSLSNNIFWAKKVCQEIMERFSETRSRSSVG